MWNKNGYVVTNYHVLYEGNSYEVISSENNSYKAVVAGTAPEYDLAVLHVPGLKDKLSPLPLGDSGELKVGQKVLAIGNPFGLSRTLTTGIISALDRNIHSITGHLITNVIQTDAAINPGSSGGPLLDSFGRVIGINLAIYSPSGAYAGVGFALPANVLNRIIPQLISKGKFTRGGLGISLIPDSIRNEAKIQGAIIYQVLPGGAASEAGLQGTEYNEEGRLLIGDIIISINDNPVSDNSSFLSVLSEKKPGETVNIIYIRNNKQNSVDVILQKME